MSAKTNFAKFALGAATILYPAVADAQSNGEWFSEYRANPAHANAILRETFEKVRVKAVQHYKSTNDTARADFVAIMKPDMQLLADRVQTARSIDENAPIERACQGYIVDASRPVKAKQ